jgi:hypothetical protein
MTGTAADNFTIDKVFPWGRTLDEYARMFDLSDADLRGRILGVADGPASFNAELTRRGGRVVSCDPLYRFGAEEIRTRVAATRDVMLDLVRREAHRFVWNDIRSPEHLGEIRMGAMAAFLDDYDAGRGEGRYVTASLPSLGLDDSAFDLAIVSHLLFLYSDDFSFDFHVESLIELSRIARDVRVFPLLDMRGQPSAYVQPVTSELDRLGLTVERCRVNYEFQRGGNEMLRITGSR